VFPLIALLAVVGVTTATKNFVHVVDKDTLSTVGTRFVFTQPIVDVTLVAALSKCHSVVVRDGSSESDSTASLRFGFGESYFRANGWRLCTPMELSTVSAITKLPDGNYITQSSVDGDNFTGFKAENGRLLEADEFDFVEPEAYTAATHSAVCCSAAQFEHVGVGDVK
jgi:hypothetical protein